MGSAWKGETPNLPHDMHWFGRKTTNNHDGIGFIIHDSIIEKNKIYFLSLVNFLQLLPFTNPEYIENRFKSLKKIFLELYKDKIDLEKFPIGFVFRNNKYVSLYEIISGSLLDDNNHDSETIAMLNNDCIMSFKRFLNDL